LPIDQRVLTLRSHSGLRDATALVLWPKNEHDLKRIFDYAQREGHRVTMRAGGHAFDDQSIGDDLVVSMKRFRAGLDHPRKPDIKVHPHPRQPRVTVGAGVTWGEVARELMKHGLVMPGTVTSSQATAGGTLASDCLSRFSPVVGKEGERVQSFKLMTVDGTTRTFTPPRPGSPRSSLGARTFLGTISGFGYLGALLEITYRVARVSPDIRVKTRISKHDDFSRLARALVPSASSSRRPARDAHAIWAGLYPRGLGDQAVLIMDSSFTNSSTGPRFPLFGLNEAVRTAAHWPLRLRFLSHRILRAAYDRFKDNEEFTDKLMDFLFFMDANTRAREIASKLRSLPEIQQTFFLPRSDEPQARLERWLDLAEERLLDHKLQPIMVDVGYLRQDSVPFYLSPSAHCDGFAVSYAFASDQKTLERGQRALWEMSEILWHSFGGRVSLVKNVYVNPRTLARMYRGDVRRFFKLKRELDPCCILHNAFLERAFPEYCAAAGCHS
jgi:decaprenylphospho-beta-D-ribofuranose 2-oxidase